MKPGDLLAAKYRLEHLLGTGGMGKVFAAVNESTGRPVAVKLMHSPTHELRSRMLREARAGGTLKHKNIVDIYDVGETENGDPFLVMERLTGETLEDRLAREGALRPTDAVDIVVCIVAALKAAHARGIIHRDLKPANVFLHREANELGGEDEVVKVLDFGVSKHLQEQTSTVTAGLVGSPAYMSPEQARAEPNIDPRSDLWSVGVLLFEMLSGRRPFLSTSLYVLITEVVTGPIPSIAVAVPTLSPALVHVVERCLVREVDARVSSADELLRLLGFSYDGTQSSPRPRLPSQPFVDHAGSAPRPRVMGDGPPSEEEATRLIEVPVERTKTSLVLVGEDAATVRVGGRSGRRGPSNAVVALVACVAGLLLIAAFGAAVLRVPSAESTATAAAAPKPQAPAEPSEATTTTASPAIPPIPQSVVTTAPSAPPPVATTAPETPASSEPVALPRPGEAKTATHATARPRTHDDGKPRLKLP